METRLYGLFEKDSSGKWVRVLRNDGTPFSAFKKSSAVHIYQGALLARYLSGGTIAERSLRVVKE